MSNIIWSKEYSVGVDTFDFHHRRIFSILNNLREALENNLGEEVSQILEDLFNYGKYHLKKEEEAFEEFSYPDKETHKEFHTAYNNKVRDFIDEQKTLDLNEVLKFLEDWWLNHILKEDKKYSEFFEGKNI